MTNQQHICWQQIFREVRFATSRSGGAGGQHVNKTETKVEIRWNIQNSQSITDLQKNIISAKLSNRIDSDGWLILTASRTRSQLQNKKEVMVRLQKLITEALHKQKKRVATKPSKGSVRRRIESKKRTSETKKLRKKIDPNKL